MSSTDCSKGPYGPIGSWDVSAVTNMGGLFADAKHGMFFSATSFNADLSKWEVSSVINMSKMFNGGALLDSE